MTLRGTKLGPYEILAPIGAGGMGEVYKAKDTRLERTVAVKVLPQHLSSSPDVRQRFEREAKTISQLSHPHICALYDVGHEGDVEYLVMELLEGETLSDRLAKGALPLEQTLRFGQEIADALEKAHRQGIVHRDLKPGNVMLTKSGVKLLDFGLAKEIGAANPTSGATSLPTELGTAQNLTREGHDPRNVPVHVARAARGQGGRRAVGHLRLRRRALRDGDGQEGVLGSEPGLAHLGDSPRRPAADLADSADLAASARSRRPDLPRQGSRGSLAIGRRSEARAALDRRRIAERGGDSGRGRSRSAPARERPRLGRRGGGSRGGDPPRVDPRARALRPTTSRARVSRPASESRVPAHRRRRLAARGFAGRIERRVRRRRTALDPVAARGGGQAALVGRKPDGGPSGPPTAGASASSRAASSRSSTPRAGRSRRSPMLPRRAAPPGGPTERSCSRRTFAAG